MKKLRVDAFVFFGAMVAVAAFLLSATAFLQSQTPRVVFVTVQPSAEALASPSLSADAFASAKSLALISPAAQDVFYADRNCSVQVRQLSQQDVQQLAAQMPVVYGNVPGYAHYPLFEVRFSSERLGRGAIVLVDVQDNAVLRDFQIASVKME